METTGKHLPQKEVSGFPTIPVDNFVENTGTAPGILRHCDKAHSLLHDEAKKFAYKS